MMIIIVTFILPRQKHIEITNLFYKCFLAIYNMIMNKFLFNIGL